VIALAAVILGGCGSPRTTAVEDASLEQGIVSFIDGDLDRAESLFLEVTRESRSDENLQAAYLYLGRIYLARGDYVKSADALSAGKSLGGDVRFDEYFEEAQRHLRASRARMGQLERITREQLAALIADMFGGRLTDGGVEGGAVDQESPDRDPMDALRRAGIMVDLPDGESHAEAAVTRPAFYVIVSRLANALGAADTAGTTLFSRGYKNTVGGAIPPPGKETEANFVTGREAVGTLEALEGLLGDAKGE
jgi:hypothetical protein